MSSPQPSPTTGGPVEGWSVASLLADPERCYRAVLSRDRRFDGRIVLAVASTGIYCRPSCPTAVRPKRANARFYATAAAAQGAGFRACKRCRPDAAPGSPEWSMGDDLVNRAMRAISAGEIDRLGVDGLAGGLSVSPRHLTRVLQARVAATPLSLARARRAHAARQLLEHSDLSMTEVAFAAGFGSVRQFNETVREVYDRTPSGLRGARLPDRNGHGGLAPGERRHPTVGTSSTTGRDGEPAPSSAPASTTLRLAVRPPFDADEVIRFLSFRALPGVEQGTGSSFTRMLSLPCGPAVITLRPDPGDIRGGASSPPDRGMQVEVWATDLADLTAAVNVAERLCDATCDPEGVVELLGADPHLGPSVRAHPGRRMPACADGFEALVRAVLGQQVTLARGVSLAGQLVEAVGRPAPDWAPTGLTHLPLEAADVAEADLSALGMPNARRRALTASAQAVLSGSLSFDVHASREATRQALLAVPGIGPWTADYVALRGLADPDAFPIGDVALQRGAADLGMDREPSALLARAESWRPWRALAAAHLWANAGNGVQPRTRRRPNRGVSR